jgi:hypothetical protein
VGDITVTRDFHGMGEDVVQFSRRLEGPPSAS